MLFTQKDLAISTMWNFRRAGNGEELLQQLAELGFSRVELNYRVRAEWLPGIKKVFREGWMVPSSIHNVFPATDDPRFGTDSVLLGFEDETLRRQAVELSKRSIDWAAELGAAAVVFHPTEVPLPPEKYDEPLKQLIAAHQTGTEAYRALHAEMLRERKAAPYISRMLRSVEELADYVVKHGLPVRLGMENRAMCHQVPVFAELETIVDTFPEDPVGVWLDTGHAIMMTEMGLQAPPLPQKAAQRIIGMHIHDAADALDHYAPCTLPGDVLAPYRSCIRSCPNRVLELSGRLTAEEIRMGTECFVARYGGDD